VEFNTFGTLMKKTGAIKHYRMNFRLGMFAYLMHRVTGIMLLVFSVLYILSLSAIFFGPLAFDKVMIFYELLAVRIIISVFILALGWHALSGVKIFLINLFKADRLQGLLTVLQMIFFAVGAALYFIYGFRG
jgi:succinate dehydrogenase / fumarate reductase, cytochrome b subunit